MKSEILYFEIGYGFVHKFQALCSTWRLRQRVAAKPLGLIRR